MILSLTPMESNAWNSFVTLATNRINPWGRVFCSKGLFYWDVSFKNIIVALNNANIVWTKIALPEGCRNIHPENLSGYDGKVMLVEHKEVHCDCISS